MLLKTFLKTPGKRKEAPSTVCPLARDPRVLVGWPLPLGFGSGRALATGTAWAALCLIHHHRAEYKLQLETFMRTLDYFDYFDLEN